MQRTADIEVSRAGRDMRRAIRSIARSGIVSGHEDTGAALELVAALLLAVAAAELHRACGDAHSAAAAVKASEQFTRYQRTTEPRPTSATGPDQAARPVQAQPVAKQYVPPPMTPTAAGAMTPLRPWGMSTYSRLVFRDSARRARQLIAELLTPSSTVGAALIVRNSLWSTTRQLLSNIMLRVPTRSVMEPTPQPALTSIALACGSVCPMVLGTGILAAD